MSNVLSLQKRVDDGDKLTMVTAYDYSFARIINQTDIDIILVGDSAAMVMHGYDSTLPIDCAQMAVHVAAVRRGAADKFIVGDLPFMACRRSLADSVDAVTKLMQAGAHSVKLEGAGSNTETIAHLVESGVPVMGHLGLTPQSVHALGGYRVQCRSEQAHQQLLDDAHRLEQSGCFSLVLECVPAKLAAQVASQLRIPVIGIGAGNGVDGQVLVMQDLLGMNQSFSPSFVRRYLDAESLFTDAFNRYAADVRSGDFPDDRESFE